MRRHESPYMLSTLQIHTALAAFFWTWLPLSHLTQRGHSTSFLELARNLKRAFVNLCRLAGEDGLMNPLFARDTNNPPSLSRKQGPASGWEVGGWWKVGIFFIPPQTGTCLPVIVMMICPFAFWSRSTMASKETCYILLRSASLSGSSLFSAPFLFFFYGIFFLLRLERFSLSLCFHALNFVV